jgi:hypothetical protein
MMSKFFGRHSEQYPILEIKAGRDLSLGLQNIGRNRVDLCFSDQKSKWDKLGDYAALLFIDLNFTLTNHKLAYVEVELSFDTPSNVTSITTVANDTAPKLVQGPELEQNEKSSGKFIPEVGVQGFANVPGIGLDEARDMVKKYSWVFSSSRLPSEQERLGGQYTRAQWIWLGNPISHRDLVSSLHTALIVGRENQPLAITVNISGKLARGWSISSMKAAPTVRRKQLQQFDESSSNSSTNNTKSQNESGARGRGEARGDDKTGEFACPQA